MTSTAMRFEFVDDAKEEALSKKFVPKNTEKSTQWALSTFFSWLDKSNECFKDQPDSRWDVQIHLLSANGLVYTFQSCNVTIYNAPSQL